jgi:cytochrome P450
MTFRRTAVAETELGGKKILPGDKVVMFYPSGNRDADVFADPERFDLSRKPNPHVGFGGGGVHYCLGNQLAKSQLRAMFSQLLTRIPDFRASEPVLLGTNFMRGVKRMRLQFTPEKS